MRNRNRRSPRVGSDESVQRAILALLLESVPICRTFPELTREIGDRECVERAAYALSGFGLVEIQGGLARTLKPTMAARSCHRLDAW